MTWEQFWMLKNAVLQIVYFGLLFVIVWYLGKLIKEGQNDRRARANEAAELREAAITLTERTSALLKERDNKIVQEIKAVTEHHEQKLEEVLTKVKESNGGSQAG